MGALSHSYVGSTSVLSDRGGLLIHTYIEVPLTLNAWHDHHWDMTKWRWSLNTGGHKMQVQHQENGCLCHINCIMGAVNFSPNVSQ